MFISIPATFIGVVIAGLWSINRGKDLDKDSEFQEKIADPEQKEFIYGGLQEQSLLNIILPKSAYQAALVFLLGIVVIAIFGSFPQLLLTPINFDAEFEANMQRAQAAAAEGQA